MKKYLQKIVGSEDLGPPPPESVTQVEGVEEFEQKPL